jgi:large subunit ribosomal protein L29
MKLREIKAQVAKFRGMDAAALGEQLAQLKREEFNLRFQQATGQLEKTSRMRDVGRMIARARTLLAQKSPEAEV